MNDLQGFDKIFWLSTGITHVIGFEDLKNLKTLKISQNIIATHIIASIGINMDKMETTMEVPVSTTEITGFAIPAVAAVEANLVVLVEPFIVAAVPPPAIIANAQVIVGSKSLTIDTITIVPATAANGIATVSNKLSNQGIK